MIKVLSEHRVGNKTYRIESSKNRFSHARQYAVVSTVHEGGSLMAFSTVLHGVHTTLRDARRHLNKIHSQPVCEGLFL